MLKKFFAVAAFIFTMHLFSHPTTLGFLLERPDELLITIALSFLLAAVLFSPYALYQFWKNRRSANPPN